MDPGYHVRTAQDEDPGAHSYQQAEAEDSGRHSYRCHDAGHEDLPASRTPSLVDILHVPSLTLRDQPVTASAAA
jgi:hypothetical protein